MTNALVDTSTIPGWGVDADPQNDPTFPMRHQEDQRDRGLTWQRPDQQKPTVEVLRSIEPLLTVSDLQRSIKFYTEALGFFVSDRFTEKSGALQGVMLKAGVCELGHVPELRGAGKDVQGTGKQSVTGVSVCEKKPEKQTDCCF